MQVAYGARALGLRAVQLHGDEDALYIRALRGLLPEETEIWAAAAVGREVPRPRLGSDRTLFDSQVGGRSGGTGIAFDWSRLEGRADLGRSVLAGGLRPSNAARRGPGRRLRPRRRLGGRDGARAQGCRPALRLLRGAPAGGAGGGGVRLSGRFGAYGGAYVPEILVPAIEQLEAAFLDAVAGSGFPGGAGRAARQICRAADPAHPLPQPRLRAGPDLSEARGPAPRRRPQDQPGARPGAARPADGQEPADRRDRRRPARSRHRPRRRPVRPRRPGSTWAPTMSSGRSSTSSGWS